MDRRSLVPEVIRSSGTNDHQLTESPHSSSARHDSDLNLSDNSQVSLNLGTSNSIETVEGVARRKRKRRRSRAKNKILVELARTEQEENGIDADTESCSNTPTPFKVPGRKRKKRKHHSHPQPSERICTNATASSDNFQTPQVSSVSDTEEFELVDDFRNLYASARLFEQPPGGLRPIAIDGCNVAWGHGNDQEFSYKGICLAADYFRSRGHKVKAFVPRQHQHLFKQQIVDEMVRDEILIFTPSRNPGNQDKRITAYDDRFIVQYAVITGSIIISNDNFQDLWIEQPTWRETITNRVLQHTWISKDILMFQLDPMGRKGQSLDQFLRFPPAVVDSTNSSTSVSSSSRSKPRRHSSHSKS